jgi:hypothetical protein
MDGDDDDDDDNDHDRGLEILKPPIINGMSIERERHGEIRGRAGSWLSIRTFVSCSRQ